MSKIEDFITKLPDILFKSFFFRRILAISKRIVLPGFDGVTLYEVARFFYVEMGNIHLSDRCAAVTFNFLTALPPTLLFLFTLVPYLPMHNVEPTILETLRLISPNQNSYNSISKIVIDFLHKERRELLSVSLLLTLFYSSNGMMGLMRYFDRDLRVYVKRNAFQRRWRAIKLTLLLIVVVLLSIVALIIQTQDVNNFLLQVFGNIAAVKIFSMLLIIIIIFCAISLIYIYGPSLSHRFRFVSPGSVFATLSCVLLSAVFFFMVNNFLNYDKVYGSIGTVIAFFVWIWMNTMVIMLGYDLNISILLGKIHRENPVVKTAVD